MGWLINFIGGPLIGSVVDKVSGFFQRKQEAKNQLAVVEGKIALARQEVDGRVELADQELAVLRTKTSEGTWKDEFALLIVTCPIIVGFVGAVFTIFDPVTGGQLLEAAEKMEGLMTGEDFDYNWLLVAGITSSLGIRMVR